MNVGTKVRLRDDVLQRHARSVPAHLGYNKHQLWWRDTLRKLEGKIGIVSNDGKFVTVDFDGTVIGIESTELVEVKDV